VALLICGGADAADKVRLSVSSLDTAFLTPAVAHKRGFFKEEGIEAEIIRMNANVSITALATGDIDYTMSLRFGDPRCHSRPAAQGHSELPR
jgi:ABC-type nitrate/sulfonate/bicarbonate transport system substrate-binding protein